MLTELPFFPRPLPAPERLLLIPHCHHRAQWQSWLDRAHRIDRLLGTEIVHFEKMAVVTGFLGYPQLLTVLSAITHWREKTLYFLGTAGVLNSDPCPDICTVSDVVMTPEVAEGFEAVAYDMIPFAKLPPRRVVTVDLPHRETTAWLDQPAVRACQRVEMELFPVRALYGRPFTALLVGSDRVGGENGSSRMAPYSLVKKNFISAFSLIMEAIDEA